MAASSIFVHVLVPVLLAVAINALIFAQRLNAHPPLMTERPSSYSALLPPGWAIGVIWVFVLACLGAAHHQACTRGSGALGPAAVAIVLTIAYCLAYPFLTSLLQARQSRSKVLDTAALLAASATAIAVASEDARALLLVAPLLLWAGYVNVVGAIQPCGDRTAKTGR